MKPKTIQLSAVTVCVHYSDTLELTIRNRVHFDQWTIVTVETDIPTQILCRTYGLHCVVSRSLDAAGLEFHAAFNKAAAINEGLRTLPHASWAVIIDADILLPEHFREMVSACALVPGTIYGAAGRRICRNKRQLCSLAEMEPWSLNCSRQVVPLGYFQLFYNGTEPNRYDASRANIFPEIHDDIVFVRRFHADNRKVLPFTVLHIGCTGRNWGGYTTNTLSGANEKWSAQFSQAPVCITDKAGAQTIAVIGYYPDQKVISLVRKYNAVYLVDENGIHQASGSRATNDFTRALRLQWDSAVPATTNVKLLGPNCDAAWANLCDDSLDALYIRAEFSGECFCDLYPVLLRKLRLGAVVFGELYGCSLSLLNTEMITLAFGVPEWISETGSWSTIYKGKDLVFRESASCGIRKTCVFIICDCRTSVIEFLRTFIAVTKQASADVRVIACSFNNQFARIFTARGGGEWLDVDGICYVGNDPEASLCLIKQLAIADRTNLVLHAGIIPVGSLEEEFRRSHIDNKMSYQRAYSIAAGSIVTPLLIESMDEFNRVSITQQARLFSWENVDSASDEACEILYDLEVEVMKAVSTDVRVCASACIVLITESDQCESLLARSALWRMSPHTTFILLCCSDGVPDSQIMELCSPGQKIVWHSDKESISEAASKLLRVAVRDARFIFLPNDLSPQSGAELFIQTKCDEHSFVQGLPGSDVAGETSIANYPFMVSRDVMEQLSRGVSRTNNCSMECWNIELLGLARAFVSCDSSQWGWSHGVQDK